MMCNGYLRARSRVYGVGTWAFALLLMASPAAGQGYIAQFDSSSPVTPAEAVTAPGITFNSSPPSTWEVFPSFFKSLSLGQLFQPSTAGSIDISFATLVTRCGLRFAQSAAPTTSSLILEAFSGDAAV